MRFWKRHEKGVNIKESEAEEGRRCDVKVDDNLEQHFNNGNDNMITDWFYIVLWDNKIYR